MDRANRAASATLESLSNALSHNLRMHARKYESISALCRACDVNRQQFNKYLTGETLPSLLNLAKIAGVLGLSLDELCTPPAVATPREGMVGPLPTEVPGADRMPVRTGYYLASTFSAVYLGHWTVAVVKIFREYGGYRCKAKLRVGEGGIRIKGMYNLYGPVVSSRDAIYIDIVFENYIDDSVRYIFQSQSRYSADLIGIRAGINENVPPVSFAAPVYMQYFGKRPDLRKLLRQSGIFELGEIDERQRKVLAQLEARTQNSQNMIRIGSV